MCCHLQPLQLPILLLKWGENIVAQLYFSQSGEIPKKLLKIQSFSNFST